MEQHSRAGFTLVEIVITTTILVIISVIALPNFLKYRQASAKSACVANLKEIEAAVSMAKLAGAPAPSESELFGPHKFIKAMPTCPNNNAPYQVFDPPECPAGDASHVMPPND